MEWNVLAVGDVVADCGVSMIEKHLPRLRRQVKADFTVVNGENAAILGITRDQAEAILGAGADVITMGNHTFGRREICRAGAGACLTAPWGRSRSLISLAGVTWTTARTTPSCWWTKF